jgi:hypothetical protein
MAVTGDELREILRDHTSAVTSPPHLAADVERRVRRQRRQTTAFATAGLAVVLVAAAGVVVPRMGNDAAPVTPVQSPTPAPSAVATVSHTATIAGMSVRTVGPAGIYSDTPFTVTVTVTNPTAKVWTGTVGVGLSRTTPVANASDSFLSTVQGSSTAEDFGILLADGSTLLDGMDDSARITVAPGASVDVVRRGRRWLGGAAWGPNHGWVPWLTPLATPFGPVGPLNPDPATYPLVSVTPAQSNSPCAATTISTAVATHGDWALTTAYTATSSSPGNRPRWTKVRGLPGAVSRSLSSVTPGEAELTPVVSGLAAYGIVPATAAGNLEEAPPTSLATAGDYVSFSGIRKLTVTFSGTCNPSGAALSGTFVTFDDETNAILDCSVVPPATSPGALAARYCPNGTRARRS